MYPSMQKRIGVTLLVMMIIYVASATEIPLGTLSTLSTAIDNAQNDDIIVMAAGVWTGCSSTRVSFPDRNITIKGASDGDVIIDCVNRNDPVFAVSSVTTSTIRIESITIRRSRSAIVVRFLEGHCIIIGEFVVKA